MLIGLDNDRGLLDLLAGPLSPACPREEQIGCAAEFVAALVSRGFCRIYELENSQWILEVRLPGISNLQRWIH